jgi:ppGpp synthetase/RelA/SpoT-type nucleotidyltranferase
MPLEVEALRLQFLEKVRFYEELRAYVLSKIQSEIKSSPHTPIKYFKTRIKSFERFQKKTEDKCIATIAEAFSTVNDVLGVRLICLYKTELQEVCDWVETSFEKLEREVFSWEGSGDLKPSGQELQKVWETGYTSIHYIVRIRESQSRSIDNQTVDLKDLKFEIQVRTILEEAWGEYTHQVYEDSDAPNYVLKSYQILSEYLNVINRQVEFLKTTYQSLSKDQMKKGLIEDVDFRDKELDFLDLSNFHLKNLKFTDCKCFTFTIKNSHLYNIDFDGCFLMNFDFTGSDLRRVSFLHSSGLKSLMNLKLKCQIDHSEFISSQMMNTDFGHVVCSNTTFKDVSLFNTDFHNAAFKKCAFQNVEFTNVSNLDGLEFVDCTFSNVSAKGEKSSDLQAKINSTSLEPK